MYKTLAHKLVWFPYRPENPLIGPAVIILLLAAGTTGLVRSLDIFTSLGSSSIKPGALVNWLAFLGCVVFCATAFARSDYFSLLSALLPCLVATGVTVIFSGIIALIWRSQPLTNSSILEAIISAFVLLGFVGRFAPSGGADLGKLGALYRRTRHSAREWEKPIADDRLTKDRRIALVKDVDQLAKSLKEAAPEVVARKRCDQVVGRLQSFLSASTRVDDTDFRKAVIEGNDSLTSSLDLLVQPQIEQI